MIQPPITEAIPPPNCCTEELMMDILANADERKHIVFHDELKQRSRKSAGLVGNFWFEIYDGPDVDTTVLLASSDIFDDKPKRDAVYKKLQKAMMTINQNEGLHLVEHILLRPKMDSILEVLPERLRRRSRAGIEPIDSVKESYSMKILGVNWN